VVEGDGLVCHEGTVSCFTKPIALTGANQETSEKKEESRG
jgi:phosphoribosyl-ATP pyrophosphohydrolase/phosphoribosyl-AMP cyclohydrolase